MNTRIAGVSIEGLLPHTNEKEATKKTEALRRALSSSFTRILSADNTQNIRNDFFRVIAIRNATNIFVQENRTAIYEQHLHSCGFWQQRRVHLSAQEMQNDDITLQAHKAFTRAKNKRRQEAGSRKLAISVDLEEKEQLAFETTLRQAERKAYATTTAIRASVSKQLNRIGEHIRENMQAIVMEECSGQSYRPSKKDLITGTEDLSALTDAFISAGTTDSIDEFRAKTLAKEAATALASNKETNDGFSRITSFFMEQVASNYQGRRFTLFLLHRLTTSEQISDIAYHARSGKPARRSGTQGRRVDGGSSSGGNWLAPRTPRGLSFWTLLGLAAAGGTWAWQSGLFDQHQSIPLGPFGDTSTNPIYDEHAPDIYQTLTTDLKSGIDAFTMSKNPFTQRVLQETYSYLQTTDDFMFGYTTPSSDIFASSVTGLDTIDGSPKVLISLNAGTSANLLNDLHPSINPRRSEEMAMGWLLAAKEIGGASLGYPIQSYMEQFPTGFIQDQYNVFSAQQHGFLPQDISQLSASQLNDGLSRDTFRTEKLGFVGMVAIAMKEKTPDGTSYYEHYLRMLTANEKQADSILISVLTYAKQWQSEVDAIQNPDELITWINSKTDERGGFGKFLAEHFTALPSGRSNRGAQLELQN
ncbi:MAG: hypothetical protein WCP97_04285 [bacterium]